MKENWLFPIHFESEIRKEIFIEKDIKLRRITEEEIYNFFKIEIEERTENGLIKSWTGKGGGSFLDDFLSGIFINHRIFVMSSRFILEAKDIKCVEYFQQALKLHKDGKTGILYGINSKTGASHFLRPIPLYEKEVYSLKEGDVSKIKELYDTIKRTENRKYDLMIEKFLFALSGEGIKDDHRFLELVSILEMLYLRDINIELKFRLSLRVSKVLSKYLLMEVEEVFKNMKEIYDIRSGISHSGFHEDTRNYLDKLIDYTRKSIKLFLKDNLIFENERLDKLCVKN